MLLPLLALPLQQPWRAGLQAVPPPWSACLPYTVVPTGGWGLQLKLRACCPPDHTRRAVGAMGSPGGEPLLSPNDCNPPGASSATAVPPSTSTQPLPTGARVATPYCLCNVAAVATQPSCTPIPISSVRFVTGPTAQPDPNMLMQQQLASAAVIMVGQEVHKLHVALHQCMYE